MNKIKPADPIMIVGMTDCLAVAVENAVIEWGTTIDEFLKKFVDSGLSDSFSEQEPFVTTGCTGEELVAKVYEKIIGEPQQVKNSSSALNYSEYYWVGYALALFVAESGRYVRDMLEIIPPSEWLRMYPILHEYGDELILEKINMNFVP